MIQRDLKSAFLLEVGKLYPIKVFYRVNALFFYKFREFEMKETVEIANFDRFGDTEVKKGEKGKKDQANKKGSE